MSERSHRGTIFVEDAELLETRGYAGQQYVIRLRAPKCAAAATPGSCAHLTCDPLLPMRRPLSIMRADAKAGWIDILYKIVGRGTATRLAGHRRAGGRNARGDQHVARGRQKDVV